VYAATIHYLKAVKALGSHSDGRAVVAQRKKMPAVDPLFGDGRIREDGRKIHPMYLYRVKKPSESTGEWDLYTLVKKVPGEEAFRPIRDGGCALIGGR
jgi:branched-chain amino acid transport system substrate-binding protein